MWIELLVFAAPPLIYYKGLQQSGAMLEGWARRKRISLPDGRSTLGRDNGFRLGGAIWVASAEAAILLFWVLDANQWSLWWIALAGLPFFLGLVLQTRAIARLYRRLGHGS